MQTSRYLMASAMIGTLVGGCVAAEPTPMHDEEVEATGAAVCENPYGVNSVMAALAVAAGREMNRVLGMRDFVWNYSTGRLETTTQGRRRCLNSWCPNVEALLALQSAPPYTVQMPDGVYLNSTVLRNTLKTNWEDFQRCFAQGTCPQVHWDLKYRSWAPGTCDVNYYFDVYEQYSPERVAVGDLWQYYNHFVFLGYPENTMLDFHVKNGQISIDPTAGLNEGGTTMSGSCANACTKFSASSIAGQCCSCNGRTRRFARSTFSSTMYLCSG